MPEDLDSVKFKLTLNDKLVDVEVFGRGTNVASIIYGDKQIPSLIIPSDLSIPDKIIIKLGEPDIPVIKSTKALVINPYFDKENNILEFDLNSFEGHRVETKIISPNKIKGVNINNIKTENSFTVVKKDSLFECTLRQNSSSKEDHYSIYFESR